MKTILKFLAVVAVVLLLVPLVRYRSLKPCRMLERELVERVEREVQAARDTVREAVAGLGETAARGTEQVASTVGHLVTGVATGAVRAKVERMSTAECVRELWRLGTGRS